MAVVKLADFGLAIEVENEKFDWYGKYFQYCIAAIELFHHENQK